MTIDTLIQKIRTIPDFPKAGINYKDIAPLFQDAKALALLNDHLIARYQSYSLDYIAGIESRGFPLGAMLAVGLNAGFVMIRKEGKLPHSVHQQEHTLEYGAGILEIHKDALHPNANVLITDDLLATGGTLQAGIQLIEKAGGKCVEACCLIELPELKGKEKLSAPFYSVLTDSL